MVDIRSKAYFDKVYFEHVNRPLGSSAEYRTVANLFGVGTSTVCDIVKEVCEDIWRVMKPEYLNAYPLSEEKLREYIAGFEQMGFPQCFEALDGCHIEVKSQANEAVDYYNFKGWYSMVLLALVDSRLCNKSCKAARKLAHVRVFYVIRFESMVNLIDARLLSYHQTGFIIANNLV